MYRDLSKNAVVILRIPLRDEQRLAPSLRGPEIIAVPDGLTVKPPRDLYGDVMSLLHLGVKIVVKRLLIGAPVGSGGAGARRRLVARVASVRDESARERVRRVRRDRLRAEL